MKISLFFFLLLAAVVILQVFKIALLLLLFFSYFMCCVSVEQTRFNLPYVGSEKLIFITLIFEKRRIKKKTTDYYNNSKQARENEREKKKTRTWKWSSCCSLADWLPSIVFIFCVCCHKIKIDARSGFEIQPNRDNNLTRKYTTKCARRIGSISV